MKIFWGFVLLAFGLAYFGAGLNWWGYDVPNSLWQFWPLILVFWGLDLMTKKSAVYVPVMIIAVILSGAFIYVSLYNQTNRLSWFGETQDAPTVKTEFSEPLPAGVKKATVNVQTGAVDFVIKGDTEQVLSGDLVSNFSKPETTSRLSGEEVVANLSTVNIQKKNGVDWWFGRDIKNNLTLALNKSIPTQLNVESGAAKLDFDLSHYIISGMSVKSGASSINLKFGPQIVNGANIVLETGASSLDLDFPDEVGVKITAETGLSSKEFTGYIQKDAFWYSPNYDAARTKVNLSVKAGVSSVKIK
jgi:hypothetical protein